MNSRRTIAVIGLFLFLILGGLVYWNRGRFAPSPPPPPAQPILIGKEVRLDSPAPPKAGPVSSVAQTPLSIRFKLTLPPEHAPALDTPILFSVPPDRAITPRLISYRVGEAVLPLADGASSTKTLEGADPAKITAAVVYNPTGVMRRWSIGALRLNADFFAPFAVADPAHRGALQAEIALEWKEPYEPPAAPPFPAELAPDRAYGKIMSSLVANPEELPLYQLAAPPLRPEIKPRATAPWSDPKLNSPARRWARLRLKDEGIYRLRVDDLIAAGFPPAGVRAAAVRLFSAGEPVALLRVGSGDGQKIFFWHPRSESQYSPERIYWATLADDLPDPLLEAPSAENAPGDIREFLLTTRTAILNRDKEIKIESGNFLAIQKMEWVDAPLRRNPPLDIPLDFHALASGNEPVLHARLKFYYELSNNIPRFKVDLKAGEQIIGSAFLKSREDTEQTIDIPVAYAKEGHNEFTLSLGEEEGVGADDSKTTVWLNEVIMDYPSRPALADGALTLRDVKTGPGEILPFTRWTPLDPKDAPEFADAIAIAIDSKGKASGAIRPIERSGQTGYLWPGSIARVEIQKPDAIHPTPNFEIVQPENLAVEDEGADYLIISHREFMEEARRVADLRARRGLRVKLVDIQSVYDNFSGGALTPEAIRDFLAWTLTHWRKGAPAYVLLVGDCTSDYLGLTHTDVRNWIPSYSFDAGLDDWASDYWLGVVAGADDLSDFMIGRLSVSNKEDARAVVDKILAYTEKPNPGPWRARLGFVADDGGFIEPMEELRGQHTPEAYEERTTYLDGRMPLEDNWYLPSQIVHEKRLKVSPVATAQIRDTFNDGAAYVTYYGHGSPNIWMEERVWFGGNSTNSDNQHLADSGHMSFVTTMTCNTGAIDYPVPKGLPGGGWNICISEDMMRVKNGGAIALYVPSGPSVTGIQHAMSLQLHGAMFGDHFRRLGEMIALSGARYIAAGNQRELAYMLILLGDPALDLELTQNLRTFTPPSKFYRPRDSIQFTLADIQPPAGKFTAALVSDAKGAGGRVLARRLCGGAETPYADGRIPVDLSVPFDAPLGPAHLQLYAWDERTTRDLAVSADFEIAQPKLEILNARSVIAEDGNTRVKVEIANRGPIPAREERIELTLPGGEQTSGAAPALFSVDASSSTTLEIPVNLFGKDTPRRPRLLDVRLATSFPPADDLPYDAIFRRLAILPPRESSGDVWAGLMPGLSDWTSPPDPSPAKLKVAAVLPLATDHPTTSRFNVALLDALGNPITQQPIIPREGISETEFELSGELRERAGLGTIKLKLGEGQTSPSLALDSVGVAEIPHNFARLRIRPESVRIEPENPFDGQTILVDFEVENAGSLVSPPFTVSLYDKSPLYGGQILTDHLRGNSQTVSDPIQPGRFRALTLRWDPNDNAGDPSIWIRVEPQQGAAMPAQESDLMLEKKIHVRKKADLVRGATGMEEKPAPDGKKEYTLTGEITNQGETEAFNVMVVFYRSAVKTAENEVGRVVLPVVKPGEKAVARLALTPEMRKFLAAGGSAPQPSHGFALNWLRRNVPAPQPAPAPAARK